MPKIILSAITLAVFTLIGSLAHADSIKIHDPYMFSSRPNAPTSAAFMTIHNHSDHADHLLDVRSDIAARTQLHSHEMNAEGVLQMTHMADGFEMAPHSELRLSRGGNHVMFMGMKAPLIDGETLEITLVFEIAGEVVVQVLVDQSRLTETVTPMDHSQMTHDDMTHGDMDHTDMDHGAMDPSNMDQPSQ